MLYEASEGTPKHDSLNIVHFILKNVEIFALQFMPLMYFQANSWYEIVLIKKGQSKLKRNLRFCNKK